MPLYASLPSLIDFADSKEFIDPLILQEGPDIRFHSNRAKEAIVCRIVVSLALFRCILTNLAQSFVVAHTIGKIPDEQQERSILNLTYSDAIHFMKLSSYAVLWVSHPFSAVLRILSYHLILNELSRLLSKSGLMFLYLCLQVGPPMILPWACSWLAKVLRSCLAKWRIGTRLGYLASRIDRRVVAIAQHVHYFSCQSCTPEGRTFHLIFYRLLLPRPWQS